MEKIKNQETGAVDIHFTKEEGQRLKIFLIGGAALLTAVCGAAIYSVYAMTTLRAENTLYRNQLQMAEQKMEKLSDKVEGIEKISKEVQGLLQQGQQPQGGAGAGGVGGASTVPDQAEKAEPARIHDPGELLSEIVRLDEIADQQLKLIIGLRSDLMSRSYAARAIYQRVTHDMPSIWPVVGSISSGFGWRVSPAGIGSSYHEGVDIATDYNIPVHVTADGVVTRAGWMDGYGYLVEVRHADGITTRYGHNSALLVYEGQELHQGDTVALAGSTGNSTGPHCHYEVRINGTSVDPTPFLHE